jgi:hypothetical protein
MKPQKNWFSFTSLCLVALLLIFYRVSHSSIHSDRPLMVTTWDAFGYYMYLPSAFIYDDFTELKWLPEKDSQYGLTGGELYQANKHKNGNYVNKYLGGVAILQLPFFGLGHLIASNSHYKADGFSPPYQYSIAFGSVAMVILSLLLLRNILLRYFEDWVVGVTLILLVAATNLIRYVSVDGAMSHAWIFPLYVFVVYTTIKWHEKPRFIYAALTGLIIGMATICRPTEAIMLFIPLLWNTHTKEAAREKWTMVRNYRFHLIGILGFGIIGILPQLIYWKLTSGSFIYNVGSKWVFLNPWFRVLFGFENGWFIYTPITIFFVVGLFLLNKFPFKKSIIVFCLLNIWIVISWFDWKYGATYSTRALVQSYPVFALPFAAFISRVGSSKWKWVFYPSGLFLIGLNLFQLDQYDKTILHYRDMNRLYYSRIFMNPNPSPVDMSLMDTDEVLSNEGGYKQVAIFSSVGQGLDFEANTNQAVAEFSIPEIPDPNERWIKVEAIVAVDQGFYSSYLNLELSWPDNSKTSRVRLFSPISYPGKPNSYAFYTRIPAIKGPVKGLVYVNSSSHFVGQLEELNITLLE